MTRNKKLVKMMALAVAASTVATSVPAYAAFDATYYAQQNPDVVAAIGTKPADLEMHYNVFGKKEGRAGSADEAGSALRQLFDAEYYAKLNPDVVAVYGNDANALFSHFLQFGIKEGRKINPYFDVNAYKKAYPDLVAAFGDDIAAYYNHFATNGIKEHRTLGGFPAEKIVPGGVAVASSGGSSSSSSGGGGGSSSKPAPKPADTTPAEQVTPTPDPTPTPEPEPEPEPIDDRSEVAKANAELNIANAELAADIVALEAQDNIKGSEIANLVSVANVNAEKAEDNLKAATTAADEAAKALKKASNDYTAARNAIQKITDSTLRSTASSVDQKRNALREADKALAAATNALEAAKTLVEETKQAKEEAETAYSAAVANATSALVAAGGNAELIAATIGSDSGDLVTELENLINKTKGAVGDKFTYKTYYGVATEDANTIIAAETYTSEEAAIIAAIKELDAYKALTDAKDIAAALKHVSTTTTVKEKDEEPQTIKTWKNTVDKEILLKGALAKAATVYTGANVDALVGILKVVDDEDEVSTLKEALGVENLGAITAGDLEDKYETVGEKVVLKDEYLIQAASYKGYKKAVEDACNDFDNIGKREEIRGLIAELGRCDTNKDSANTEYQKAVKDKVDKEADYNTKQATYTTAQAELSAVEDTQERLLEGASAEDAKLVNDLESATIQKYDAEDADTQAKAELKEAEKVEKNAADNVDATGTINQKTTTVGEPETEETDVYLSQNKTSTTSEPEEP